VGVGLQSAIDQPLAAPAYERKALTEMTAGARQFSGKRACSSLLTVGKELQDRVAGLFSLFEGFEGGAANADCADIPR
jgi:hypothetical protein